MPYPLTASNFLWSTHRNVWSKLLSGLSSIASMSRETSAALAVAGVGHLEKHTLEAEMRTVVSASTVKRDRRA
jgi:hypothetical protein